MERKITPMFLWSLERVKYVKLLDKVYVRAAKFVIRMRLLKDVLGR